MQEKKITKGEEIAPRTWGHRNISYITKEQRIQLQKLLEQKLPLKEICRRMNMSRSTIYHERIRMGSIDIPYDAEVAHQDMQNKMFYRGNTERIPQSHKLNIVTLYKMLEAELEKSHPTKIVLKQCLTILESMGANPNRIRSYCTAEQLKEILQLRKAGLSYREIALKVNRSSSAIAKIIERNNNLEQPNEEVIYERIANKWKSV